MKLLLANVSTLFYYDTVGNIVHSPKYNGKYV